MPEQIGVLVVFLLVVLFNLFVHFLQRRRQAESKEPMAEVPPPPPPRLPPRVVIAPPPLEAPPPVRMPPPDAVPSHVAPPRRPRFELRPDDLRRAMILMAVLGPCRALEPEDRGVTDRP